MNLLFVGDIMPGGVLPYQDKYISKELIDYLKEFDCKIGTLECALGDCIPFDEVKMKGKMNIIYSPEKELSRVIEMGFNVVSLANNHAFDLGAVGLRNTINLLDAAGIKHCGAGMNLEEASQPAVISVGGKQIAIFAYCQYGSVYIGHLKRATVSEPGINPFEIDRCLADIMNAKKKYDYVFVMPHWGIEYQFLPTPECVKWAHQMIDAGADGVFASHTHQVQPVVSYKSKPIAFSMGNFMFPDYYMEPPRPIWYPKDNEELENLPHFKYYPQYIDSPCVQEWNHISRIGLLVNCIISDNIIKAKVKYSYLNKENIIELYHQSKLIQWRMIWMSFLVNMPSYPLHYKFYQSRLNLIRRGYHFITRPFKKY